VGILALQRGEDVKDDRLPEWDEFQKLAAEYEIDQ